MQDWVIRYWAEALFGLVVAGFVAGYKNLHRKIGDKSIEQDAIKFGVQALLRDRIIQNYNHYIEKGFCPIYALENVHALYDQYHRLGGNGAVTKLMERLENLPTQEKEEE